MDIRTYLEIDTALVRKLKKTWRPIAASIFRSVQEAMSKKDYAQAYELAKSVDLTEVGEPNKDWIKYLLQAASVFGAKMASGDAKVTAISLGSYDSLLNRVTKLFLETLEYNATLQVYESLVQLIAEEEALSLKAEEETEEERRRKKRYVKQFTSFRRDGDDMMQLVSSLHTSRLAAWGFMAEAEILELSRYKLVAVLDGRTSKFCEFINGKTFEVKTARSSIDQILSVQSPDELRSLHPWPKQTKAALDEYAKLSEDELVSRKMHIPPFHPSCRTLCARVSYDHSKNRGKKKPIPDPTPELAPKKPVNAPPGSDAEKDVSTIETFSQLGIKMNQVDVDKWNDLVGLSPVLVLARLSGASPKKILERILGEGRIIKITESGDIKFNFKMKLPSGGKVTLNQVYDPFTKTMYANWQEFKKAKPTDAADWLRNFYTQSVVLSQELGAENFVAAATGGLAMNAHANLGFLPASTSDWYSLKTDILDELIEGGELGFVLESLTKNQMKVVWNVLATSDEKGFWALMDLPFEIQGEKIGTILTKNKKMDLVLFLDDEEALGRFEGGVQ